MPVHVCWNACLFPFRCTTHTDRRPFPSGTCVSWTDRIMEFFSLIKFFWDAVFSCRFYGSISDPALDFT